MRETDGPVIYPAMRYADAHAAIAFLERAFGFRLHALYEGPDGTVAHAELELEGAFVMLGSQKQDFVGTRTPAEAGGVTATTYLYVPDVDAVYARATAAGTDMLLPLQRMAYGAREFMARDLEGHVWSFGDYRPAAEPQAKPKSV